MANPTTIPGLPFKFQGQNVTNFTTSMGWNTSPSTLTLTVVEKKTDTEVGPAAFAGSTIGSLPVGKYFNVSFGSFNFGGILRNRTYSESVGGKKWSVILVDPREIMKNTVVLVAPSDGTLKSFGGRRVIDIFNEAGSLLDSQWTPTGMPWKTIKDILSKPTISAVEGFLGQVFQLNVDELDAKVDPEFRVGGNMLGLEELIQEVAKAAAVDWYVETNAATNPVIKIRVVDRSADAEPESLQVFAARFGYNTVLSRVESISVGKELRNETGCVILQSANREFLTKESLTTQTADTAAATPGVITSGGSSAPNQFNALPRLDLSLEGLGIFNPTELGMRTALSDFMSWIYYIAKFHKKETGNSIPDFFISLYDFSKAGATLDKTITELKNKQGGGVIGNANNLRKRPSRDDDELFKKLEELERQENLAKISYEKYRDYANKYYGKVFVYFDSKIVPEFFEEIGSAFTRGVGNKDGLDDDIAKFFEDSSGQGKERLRSNEFEEVDEKKTPGKTSAVVIFSGKISKTIVTNIVSSTTGKVVGSTTSKKLVSMEQAIEDGLVIFEGHDDESFFFKEGNLYVSANTSNGIATINPIWFRAVDKFETILGKNLEEDVQIAKALGDNISKKQTKMLDILDDFLISLHREAVQPDSIWVPMRNKISFWKTWRSEDCGNGKMLVEQDNSLDPFNFGSFGFMDDAGQRKIKRMGTLQTEADTGSVVVEGIPEFTIGSSIGKNSTLTNIAVNFGKEKITTTYTLQSFTPRFGIDAKDQIDQRAFFSNRFKQSLVKENEKTLQDLLLSKVNQDGVRNF